MLLAWWLYATLKGVWSARAVDRLTMPHDAYRGGLRPAYHGQFAVDTATQVIVGVDVRNEGSERGQMSSIVGQLDRGYGRVSRECLVDGGLAGLAEINARTELETTIRKPVATPSDARRAPHAACPGDTDAVTRWRERMGISAAKEIYKSRAATVEGANAQARNRDLTRLAVRGEAEVRAILFLQALAHDLLRVAGPCPMPTLEAH